MSDTSYIIVKLSEISITIDLTDRKQVYFVFISPIDQCGKKNDAKRTKD